MKISYPSVLLVGVIGYLSYHAIAGQQGLSQWSHMQDEIRELESERHLLALKRDQMAERVERLYDSSLDLDYLEELARVEFRFVYPNEVMLDPPEFTSQPPKNEDLFALSN